MIMGTVAYLSPEQVATGAADARSDVYAAGVLLYELLTGAPPYSGDTAISVAYRHVNSDVPPPSAVAGDVPPELDELVARATRRDPAGRPADAAALLAELRRVAEQLEVPRVPPPVPPARRRTTGRRARRPAAGEGRTRHPGPGPAPRAPARARRAGAAPGRRRRAGAARPAAARCAPAAAAAALFARLDRRSWSCSALLVGATAWWLGAGGGRRCRRWSGWSGSGAAGADRGRPGRPVTERGRRQVPEGSVIATDPAPQARLLRGSTVHDHGLHRPAGGAGDRRRAPRSATAEQAIRDAGLTPARRSTTAPREFSDDASRRAP